MEDLLVEVIFKTTELNTKLGASEIQVDCHFNEENEGFEVEEIYIDSVVLSSVRSERLPIARDELMATIRELVEDKYNELGSEMFDMGEIII